MVLEGNGKSFSAGLDLSIMRDGGEPMEKLLDEMGQLLEVCILVDCALFQFVRVMRRQLVPCCC